MTATPNSDHQLTIKNLEQFTEKDMESRSEMTRVKTKLILAKVIRRREEIPLDDNSESIKF